MNKRTKFNSFGGWLKLAGCVVVMLAGVALLANINATGWGILLLLLCPLMHVLMHRNRHADAHEDRYASTSRKVDPLLVETETRSLKQRYEPTEIKKA